MNDTSTTEAGFSFVRVLFTLLALVILVAIGYFILRTGDPDKPASLKASSTSASTASNAYAILPPATVAPKVAECSQPLTYASNGDSGPVACANGDLNVLEWNALAALEPTVLTLGYSASAAQVQSALCSDAADSASDANTGNSKVIESTVYQVAALYYGWNFSTDPSAMLSNGGC